MAQEKFCKKVLRIPCAINKVADLEMGRGSRRGRYLWQQGIGAGLGRWARKKVQGSHTSGRKRILNVEVRP
jgi:hypothetical protein